MVARPPAVETERAAISPPLPHGMLDRMKALRGLGVNGAAIFLKSGAAKFPSSAGGRSAVGVIGAALVPHVRRSDLIGQEKVMLTSWMRSLGAIPCSALKAASRSSDMERRAQRRADVYERLSLRGDLGLKSLYAVSGAGEHSDPFLRASGGR
jgi:hypothetical protein